MSPGAAALGPMSVRTGPSSACRGGSASKPARSAPPGWLRPRVRVHSFGSLRAHVPPARELAARATDERRRPPAVHRTIDLPVPLDTVWDAIVAGAWLGTDVEIDARPGGALRVDARVGVVEAAEPGRSLSFWWTTPDGERSRVACRCRDPAGRRHHPALGARGAARPRHPRVAAAPECARPCLTPVPSSSRLGPDPPFDRRAARHAARDRERSRRLRPGQPPGRGEAPRRARGCRVGPVRATGAGSSTS